MRRIVVTGMGLVTPLASGVKASWGRLIESESGIDKIQSFDVSDMPCQIAGMVPLGDQADGYFNFADWVNTKERRKMDEFIVYALAAVNEQEDRSSGSRVGGSLADGSVEAGDRRAQPRRGRARQG